MKMLAIASVALVVFVAGAPATAAALADEKMEFITYEISAAMVDAYCPSFEIIPDVTQVIADKMCVSDRVRSVVVAVYAQAADSDSFDRCFLIPEVRRQVNRAIRLLKDRREASTLCVLGPAYVKLSWLRAKRS